MGPAPPPLGPQHLNLQMGPSAWPGGPGAELALDPALGLSLAGPCCRGSGPWQLPGGSLRPLPAPPHCRPVPSLCYGPSGPASSLLCAWARLSRSRGPSLPRGHPALLPLPLSILWVLVAPGVLDAPANQGEMTQGSPRILSRGGWPVSAWRGRGGEGFGGAGSGGAPRIRAGETRMGCPRPSCRVGSL